jgi:hypothetical protein
LGPLRCIWDEVLVTPVVTTVCSGLLKLATAGGTEHRVLRTAATERIWAGVFVIMAARRV